MSDFPSLWNSCAFPSVFGAILSWVSGGCGWFSADFRLALRYNRFVHPPPEMFPIKTALAMRMFIGADRAGHGEVRFYTPNAPLILYTPNWPINYPFTP